jgi:hypothetical protein
VKPVPLALWIPCLVAAASVHLLVGEWAAARAEPRGEAATEPCDFQFRLVRSTVLLDGFGDERFDPRECLGWCGEQVSCGYSEEVVDGILITPRFCHWSRTDEMDLRDELLIEIEEAGAGVDWAGGYFRGSPHASGAALVLGTCGGAWSRECSLLNGIGEGVSGRVLEQANGLLEVRHGRDESAPEYYWPVRWGERRYLVEPPRWEEFLRQARAAVEPRGSIYGTFFLREGDELLPVEGEPRVAGTGR